MTRGQYLAMCAIGFVAVAAFILAMPKNTRFIKSTNPVMA